MIVVTPVPVTTSNLTSSDVPETDAPVWSAGTYTIGQQRIYNPNKRLYEVLVASTTDDPVVGAAKVVPTWLDLGPINRWKMFDNAVSNQTSNPNTIDVVITPGVVVNAVALLNISGNSAQVIVDDPVDGVVYDETIELIDNTVITNWYAYFFEPITARTDVTFLDMPQYGTADIQIIVDAGAGTALVGEAVLGRQQLIGRANYGTGVGITDYSRKETDEFGNTVVVERRFNKRADFDVTVDTMAIASVQRVLANVRATPVVYIGDETRAETIVYGFYRNFSIVISTPTLSDCSIEVEGLT